MSAANKPSGSIIKEDIWPYTMLRLYAVIYQDENADRIFLTQPRKTASSHPLVSPLSSACARSCTLRFRIRPTPHDCDDVESPETGGFSRGMNWSFCLFAFSLLSFACGFPLHDTGGSRVAPTSRDATRSVLGLHLSEMRLMSDLGTCRDHWFLGSTSLSVQIFVIPVRPGYFLVSRLQFGQCTYSEDSGLDQAASYLLAACRQVDIWRFHVFAWSK